MKIHEKAKYFEALARKREGIISVLVPLLRVEWTPEIRHQAGSPFWTQYAFVTFGTCQYDAELQQQAYSRPPKVDSRFLVSAWFSHPSRKICTVEAATGIHAMKSKDYPRLSVNSSDRSRLHPVALSHSGKRGRNGRLSRPHRNRGCAFFRVNRGRGPLFEKYDRGSVQNCLRSVSSRGGRPRGGGVALEVAGLHLSLSPGRDFRGRRYPCLQPCADYSALDNRRSIRSIACNLNIILMRSARFVSFVCIVEELICLMIVSLPPVGHRSSLPQCAH